MKHTLIFCFVLVGVLGIVCAVYATVYFGSPSSCTGTWTNCSNASTSDNTYAYGRSSNGTWGTYNLSIPSNAASISVQIGIEGRHQKFGSHCPSNALHVSVSKGASTSFGPSHNVTLGCKRDTMTWVDVTDDFGSWSSSDFSNANFKVQASCSYDLGCYLDWLPVQVTTIP